MEATVNIVIAGHVDHGKSTLIGRLLYDTESLSERIVADIIRASEEQGKEIEFAFVMDHLAEERTRAVTIDAAHTFFQSDRRRYALIDAPGHLAFLKNMITGATQADSGILVVDAARGIEDQTRRHAYLLKLIGIRHILVVINKMDKVGYEKAAFEKCRQTVGDYFDAIDAGVFDWVPVSARQGQNIVDQDTMGWYTGSSLLGALDRLPAVHERRRDLRLPIQLLHRYQGEPIAFGRVESGKAEVNRAYTCFPGRRPVRIGKLLEFKNGQVNDGKTVAGRGECVSLVADVALARGDVIYWAGEETIADRLAAKVFWMHDQISGQPGDRFILKQTTQQTDCILAAIKTKLDPSDLKTEENPARLALSEVGRVELVLDQPILTDRFQDYPGTGRFVLEAQGTQVAGGIMT